jgi:hypothetical protein
MGADGAPPVPREMPMRAAALAAVLSLSACAGGRPGAVPPEHWAGLPTLGPLEAALLYHRESGTVPPEERLIHWYGEVCGELDVSAREAAKPEARAALARAAAAAARRDRWMVPLRQTLGAYDLRRGGFPASLRKGAVVAFDRSDYCGQDLSYLVLFRNGARHDFLAVEEARARRFVRENPLRTVVLQLEVEVGGAQPGPPSPTLLVRIVRWRALDAVNGTVVAEGADGR